MKQIVTSMLWLARTLGGIAWNLVPLSAAKDRFLVETYLIQQVKSMLVERTPAARGGKIWLKPSGLAHGRRGMAPECLTNTE